MADLAAFPDLGRCRVMGVVNVTPDSFSDGGAHATPDAAVRHGLRLLDEGADLLDVGGESTRPGATRVPAEEELARVLPVVTRLAAAGAIVSVDTTRASVAGPALQAGARVVNDVSGGTADAALPLLVAEQRCAYVVMHSRGASLDMRRRAVYDDVVAEVAAGLVQRLGALTEVGVRPEQVVLDPGLGFAKTAEHDWALLGAVPELVGLGRPLLLGASRKSFLGRLLADADGSPRPVGERDDASQAITALAAAAGAWCVRVHAVRAAADAVRVAAAVAAGASRA